MQWLGFVVVVMVQQVAGLATPPPKASDRPQRCNYDRAYRMLGAHCADLNLYSVPATLKTSIEILDLSMNRIRELHNSTFQKYPDLRFLYLGDNMIQTIDIFTFEPLQKLETLDLSLNALKTIPSFILNLPALRKLYVANNSFTELNSDLKVMEKPFQAPLNYLNLANCKLHDFPDFGVLPLLEVLDVSANEFANLKPENIANLCGLKSLDMAGSINRQSDICAYKPISVWFSERGVNVIPDIFNIFNPESADGRLCPDVTFDDNDLKIYNECRGSIRERRFEKTVKKTWFIIAGCITCSLVAFVLFLYLLHKRNVKQTKRNFKKVTPTDEKPVNNPTTANLLGGLE